MDYLSFTSIKGASIVNYAGATLLSSSPLRWIGQGGKEREVKREESSERGSIYPKRGEIDDAFFLPFPKLFRFNNPI